MENVNEFRKRNPLPSQRLRINIDPSDRLFVCGQTGSGKTHLVTRLLRGMKTRKLIIDIKGRIEYPEAEITEDVDEVARLLDEGEDVIFRPPLPYDWHGVDKAFQIAFNRGNTTVYNDERGGWPRNLMINMLPFEAHCVMRGRDRNVGLWSGTQRPSWVPLNLMSEVEHFLVFRLQHKADRMKIAEMAGDEIATVRLPKRWYWYSSLDTEHPLLRPPVTQVLRVR